MDMEKDKDMNMGKEGMDMGKESMGMGKEGMDRPSKGKLEIRPLSSNPSLLYSSKATVPLDSSVSPTLLRALRDSLLQHTLREEGNEEKDDAEEMEGMEMEMEELDEDDDMRLYKKVLDIATEEGHLMDRKMRLEEEDDEIDAVTEDCNDENETLVIMEIGMELHEDDEEEEEDEGDTTEKRENKRDVEPQEYTKEEPLIDMEMNGKEGEDGEREEESETRFGSSFLLPPVLNIRHDFR